MTSEEAVRDFLQQVKETIANPIKGCDGWKLVRRPENINCISVLGFRPDDIANTILSLSITEYCDGPCHDYDQSGNLWIFGKVIAEKEVYIKLKLASLSKLRMVRIVSFHFARETLNYPFEEETIKEEQRNEGGSNH